MQVKDLQWKQEECCNGDNILYSVQTELGRLTVLDRETGYSFSTRDTETGYRDNEGKFWLVSCMFDIRDFPELTVEEAIAKIKINANTCVGV